MCNWSFSEPTNHTSHRDRILKSNENIDISFAGSFALAIFASSGRWFLFAHTFWRGHNGKVLQITGERTIAQIQLIKYAKNNQN